MATTAWTAPSSITYLPSTPTFKAYRPTEFSPCPNFVRANFGSKNNANTRLSRLRISYKTAVAPKQVSAVSSLEDGNSEMNPESGPSSSFSPREATIDIRLPRRSLIVQFTCNACSERTQKLVNRLAYERGTVFVQCSGCLQHHKLVDNLGLVVEYDLREDISVDSNTDQA